MARHRVIHTDRSLTTGPVGPTRAVIAGDLNEPFTSQRFITLRGPIPMALAVQEAQEIRVIDGMASRLTRPDLPMEITRLSLSRGWLDTTAVDVITTALLAIPDVPAPTWITEPKSGAIAVPVTLPTTVTDDEITWHITPTLSLRHNDSSALSGVIELPESGSAYTAFTDLTRAQCRALVVALASMRYWDREMGPFRTGTAVRRALRRAIAVRAMFRG
jgi:hypothetical protein